MNKKMIALIGGAGVATGVMIATNKASVTAKPIAAKRKKLVADAKKLASKEAKSIRKTIDSKVKAARKDVQSRAKKVAEKVLKAEQKAHLKINNVLRNASEAISSQDKRPLAKEAIGSKSAKRGKQKTGATPRLRRIR